MKIYINTIIKNISILTLITCSLITNAKSTATEDKKVDVKCFVELIGGRETISFWYIPSSQVSNLVNSITGRQVSIPHSKQKETIYKAHECVLLQDDFSGSKAKIVDEKVAR
ncbi:TapY2 family type IVa secretion system protein [Colwellia sp. MSW7]|uniref:TapY2 family type IVa secretion system protein n=1 Tax=Colwellia maritima TaxID=2912588 RepID=A0ABS9WYS7_9GAMM|nr:TapY2 family type IVa secretion system protein [Colwellia maritima]MCI2283145.1 TapY2 family type IVa secretion system protein [Colwellia maritima]